MSRLPIFKVVQSEPTNPKKYKPTFTFFTQHPYKSASHYYAKMKIVSSDEVDFSTVTGDKLSLIMMEAQQHDYGNNPDRDFFNNLSLAEQFLYEIFRGV